MDDEVIKGGRNCKRVAAVINYVVPMLMLVWIIHNGYTLANKAKAASTGRSGHTEGSYTALVFGVVTVAFGLVYFIIGLIIVAEVALDLFAWLRKGDTEISNIEEKEQMTISRIITHSLAVMASMFMLTWAIYYGFKLVAEAQLVVIYDRLTLLIGVISMGFGFIYLIIGMAILVENMSGRSQQEVTESDGLKESLNEVNLPV